MPDSTTRRTALAALLAAAAAPLAGCGGGEDRSPGRPSAPGTPTRPSAAGTPTTSVPVGEFRALEREFDARLGVFAVDTADGRELAYRADERFAYCSTCKAFLAAAVLDKRGLDGIDSEVTVRASDVEGWSPVTEKERGAQMTLRALCDAAVRYSDNGAANALFRELGGPRGLQSALRAIGDDTTRCDRYEVELSQALPGDERDTSTPRAMARSLREFTLGDVLNADERGALTDWLVRNTTGDKLIRAGAPKGWRIGDKTGNGSYGTRNDIALAWPPQGGKPVVLAVMSRRPGRDADAAHDDALIARAAAAVFGALG
ncbi:class A beta-lactamase [Streptomyces sp. TRM66268-LWL]|uniref:Beta-lactamase n=1 Tax=Streptomyces polyasparticus TaxID=2767826 RepID=A0ABR7SLL4_9ACTN|nr:class A beta-lactamase [Streptomyces polyasparticus]MBC9715228.1 class A beta-lactamase [Streptomyces polyasparticus]